MWNRLCDGGAGCEMESEAKRAMEVLPKRSNRYGLFPHSERTRLLAFRKPSEIIESGTFDFLGFTFYWAKSPRGYWIIKKKTVMKRQRRFMKGIWRRCSENRHIGRRPTLYVGDTTGGSPCGRETKERENITTGSYTTEKAGGILYFTCAPPNVSFAKLIAAFSVAYPKRSAMPISRAESRLILVTMHGTGLP